MGVKKALVPDLPIPTLRRVFNTRLVECQTLSFEDFKAECKSTISFLDASGLGGNGRFIVVC
jgi:hypothetical protein